MMIKSSTSDHLLPHSLLLKKLLKYGFYALIPVLVFRFYYYPSPPHHTTNNSAPDSFSFSSPSSSSSSYKNDVNHHKIELFSDLDDDDDDSPSSSSSPHPFTPLPSLTTTQTSSQEVGEEQKEELLPTTTTTTCEDDDYTDGSWVPTTTPPLYNGTTCSQTIKDNQNCMTHGRPDLKYLYYQWKPHTCQLPPFNPSLLLTSLSNKHLAFIGDSMARNQLESLICLLSSHSTPQLIYSYPESDPSKFRRWQFPSPHNVTISVYWSPFLVNGIEKSSKMKYYNTLFMDKPDPKWVDDLDGIDMVVLTIGHWYLHQAVYYEDGVVLGSNGLSKSGFNYTEIGFYGVFRKAYKTALNTIIRHNKVIDVMVTTFMPSHFEGEWDKLGACNKTIPYKSNEMEVDGMNGEMRKITLQEVDEANRRSGRGRRVVKVLDITKLSLLRPDGHPGPYMYPFPFGDGIVRERVHQDCLHFCLPGPVDTWNQIMAQIIIVNSTSSSSSTTILRH